MDWRLGETYAQDVPLGLHLGDALELNPELAALRVRELLELADPAHKRRDRGPANLAGMSQGIRRSARLHASLRLKVS
jgi:hypothetical protein